MRLPYPLRYVALPLALSAALLAPGCTTTAQLVADTAASLSSQTPSQVRTLAEALQAAKLATDAVDLYVRIGKPDRDIRNELRALNEAVHTAALSLEQDQAAGKSLTFGAFNAALDAFNAYATVKGVKH